MFVIASGDETIPTFDTRFWSEHGSAIAVPATTYFSDLELTVVRKSRPGFDAAEIATLRQAIADVAKGVHGPSKFVVFDLGEEPGPVSDDAGLQSLLDEAGDLILEAPVVSIAWGRGRVEGGDLELALACSMIVCEEDSRFSFDFGVLDCLRSYARLAHKVGFVHAERLLDNGAVLTPSDMTKLLLAKAVAPVAPGTTEIERFVETRKKRHNSAYGIFRAQRMAMAQGR